MQLALRERLLGVLCALRLLQEAAGKSPRPVTLHTALALAQNLLPKVGRADASGCAARHMGANMPCVSHQCGVCSVTYRI